MKKLSIILTLLLSLSTAYAERKALVIGNAEYDSRPLKNPPNDARDISEKLTNLGFNVTTKNNLSRSEMRKSVRDFSENLHTGDEALFYFSGHGAQVNGQNYLIPLQHDIQHEDEISDEAVSLHFILEKFTHAPSQLNIIILDACRDNPFKSRFKSSTRGLARLTQRIKGTIVAFAASAGGVSNDGDNSNGTYTQYLLKHLATPNITLNQMFNRVRSDVDKATGGDQFPMEENGLLSDVYLLKQPIVAVSKPVPSVVAQPIEQTPQPKPSISTRQAFEPKMKFIKGGTFKMGCVSDLDCYGDEKVHKVSVESFWMGQYEVTFDEWQNCVNDGGCQSNTKPMANGWGRGQRPVINVSWHDANEYTAWLNKKTGRDYRLPTEAEWEYAARAGTNTKYWWGNDITCSQADYQADHNSKDCNYKGTSKVGSYSSNKWGIYDTVGNVREWTCSAYPKDSDYDGSEVKCTNKNDSRSRVLRDGSWLYLARYVRSANRSRDAATRRSIHVGFRLSRTR